MTPLDFLAVVLPSVGHGYYCAAELTKKEHFYGETLADLQPVVDAWHEKNFDIYFALATFASAGKREAANATAIKSLFIDMDGYESKRAAGEALMGFLDKTGLSALGAPWVVSSGGGIHAYWPLKESVEITEWKPIAESFKRLCKQEALVIDMSVTADAARVLRYPGTLNHKKKYPKPRAVNVLSEGDVFDFAEISEAISSKLIVAYVAPQAPTLAIPGHRPTSAPTAVQIKLIENTETVFSQIKGCAQIEDYKLNAQEEGKEPIWRGLLSWAKVCSDGIEAATQLSALHPYPIVRMHQKLGEIKGPYSCTKMDSENPGLCQSCPHFGKITNPLVLGRVIQTETTQKALSTEPAKVAPEEFEAEFRGDLDAMPELDSDVVQVGTVMRPVPPKGFSYGRTGGVYYEKKDTAKDGSFDSTVIQVVPFDLFVVDMLKQEGEHMVHLVADRPDGVATILMNAKAIVSKDETVRALASNNVIASFGQGNDANLYTYIRACVTEASMRKAITIPTQFGWQKDHSFVFSGKVYTPDGKEVRIPMQGLENLIRNTEAHGTLEDWRGAWQVFTQRKMHTLLAMAVDSFGSTLMGFTGMDGFTWHIGARKSGTGKTLTLAAKAGVWGHPVRYRTSKSTSPVAMQQRSGLLNSLPLLIDEITSTQRGNMEWAPTFIFDYSEAQGKERMESGANKERVNNSTWQATCTLTSNVILTDVMLGAREFSSNGEFLRMLEWNPEASLDWTSEERQTLKKLNNNYGVAGEAWVRWLVKNRATADAMVKATMERLRGDFDFTDDERYWLAGVSASVAAAVLLGRKHAGIIDLPVSGIVEAFKALVLKARRNFAKSARSAEDVLNSFIQQNYGGFIVIKKIEGKILAGWGDHHGDTKDMSVTKSRVMGRVEHGISEPGYKDFFIEAHLLRKHCVAMSFGFAEFRQQMESLHKTTYVKKDLLSKTNGPTMRVETMHIHMRDERAEDLLPLDEAAA